MFADAYTLASGFTRPLIVAIAKPDGTCEAAVGSFIVVNDEGWIITAAHIVKELEQLAARKRGYLDYQAQRLAIENDAGLLLDQKKKRLRKLPVDPNWVLDFAAWWSFDGGTVKTFHKMEAADVAIGKLEPFNPASVSNYPKFKDANSPLRSGTSLCRLGFPFHEISPQYVNGAFVLPPNTFPMVFFPNEGILTRILVLDNKGPVFLGFIETSNPGLRGQSGGPIFDKNGTVWGVQSHTSHLPLGFNPPVPGGKAGQTEHQFLNVGRGVHPASIAAILNQFSVKHDISNY
jgi:hypothetical protein